jgi:hypothetical protein
MPSGSPRVDAGSIHRRPFRLRSRIFWARTLASMISTLALTPTSRHMAMTASDIALSFESTPDVLSRMISSPL